MKVKDNNFYVELEKVLDEYFPKKKCKERGAAMMLFAAAIQLHEKTVEK